MQLCFDPICSNVDSPNASWATVSLPFETRKERHAWKNAHLAHSLSFIPKRITMKYNRNPNKPLLSKHGSELYNEYFVFPFNYIHVAVIILNEKSFPFRFCSLTLQVSHIPSCPNLEKEKITWIFLTGKEKFHPNKLWAIDANRKRKKMMGMVVVGILIIAYHQTNFGLLMLTMKEKFHPQLGCHATVHPHNCHSPLHCTGTSPMAWLWLWDPLSPDPSQFHALRSLTNFPILLLFFFFLF